MITLENTGIPPVLPVKTRAIRYKGIDTCSPQWYAVRTSFRHEKIAFRDLKRQGLDVWLPLVKATRRYERKERDVEIPLLSSYLFVRIHKKEYHAVIKSPYISGFVRFGEDILPIPDKEIELIRLIIGDVDIVNTRQSELLVGDRVEIIGGKLTGLQGILEGQLNQNKVSISLGTLGYTLVLEVDPKYLRKI